MQPIPRNPMQAGMGPRMMGQGPFGGRAPMMGPGQGPFAGGNPMMGSGANPFGGRNPMMGQMMGGPQQMNRGGGGLLSKILGRGGNPAGGLGGLRGMQGATQAATRGGGGLLQSLSNPGGITGFLNNTQQVLKTAQSFGPMIQQYGPIVKNLPAMWKLYRGLKNAPDSTDEVKKDETPKKVEEKAESSVESSENVTTGNKKQTQKKKKQTQPKRQGTISHQKGASVPKLYI